MIIRKNILDLNFRVSKNLLGSDMVEYQYHEIIKDCIHTTHNIAYREMGLFKTLKPSFSTFDAKDLEMKLHRKMCDDIFNYVLNTLNESIDFTQNNLMWQEFRKILDYDYYLRNQYFHQEMCALTAHVISNYNPIDYRKRQTVLQILINLTHYSFDGVILNLEI